MSFENTIQILTGLLTPVIAVLAVIIAYRQYKTAKQKLAFDLFDRRLRIYEEVRNFLLIIIRDADVEYAESTKFINSVTEAEFLFGKEVVQYLNTIYQRAIQLRSWNEKFCDYTKVQPEGYNHSEVVEEMHKELDWLINQLEPSKEIFRKYLDLSK